VSTELAKAFLTEETVPLGNGREVVLIRPQDSEELLEEEAFEHEELLPYWAELWPSGVALARAVAGRSLKGARVLELGCGLGLVAVAAALAGGRVLATDWSSESIRFTRSNATRNGVEVDTAIVDWGSPQELIDAAPWPLVLGSDVLYEARMADQMLDLLPRLAGPGTEVLIADPGRKHAERFVAEAGASWDMRTTSHGRIDLHRLRLRPDR
jgi:predicted nicotinamide N-methyase